MSDRAPVGGRLALRLASGEFAVTAEISPPRGIDLTGVRHSARLLGDWVDAVNLTDNPAGGARLASWAASLAVMEEGVEPVCQLQCRDRNALGLRADLLGIAAMGVPNVLLLTGDRLGPEAEATNVFDLDSTSLIAEAAGLRDEGGALIGSSAEPRRRFLIGAAENPFEEPLGERAARLARKVDAGADFAQTQYVFDLSVFSRFIERCGELGVLERCAVLAGVGPIRSSRGLARLRGLPGVALPDEIAARFSGVKEDDIAEVGLDLCAEIVAKLHAMDGVAGVHLMHFSWDEAIPEVLERSGVAAARGRDQSLGAG